MFGFNILNHKRRYRNHMPISLLCILISIFILIFSAIFIPVISAQEAIIAKSVEPVESKSESTPVVKTVTPTTTTKTTDSTPTTTTKTETTPTITTNTNTETSPSTTTTTSTNTDSEPSTTSTDSTSNESTITSNVSSIGTNETNGNNSSDEPITNESGNKTQIHTFSLIDQNSTVTSEEIIENNNENLTDNVEVTSKDEGYQLESNIGNVTESVEIIIRTTESVKTNSIIQQVDLTPSKSRTNVKLTVSNKIENPPEILVNDSSFSKRKIYQYVDVKLTSNEEYIGETGIDSMTFTFSVEKSWIENESIDKNTIKMIRYHNETWQELNTTYYNETETHIFYLAETPGLSVFAVVGDSLVEESGSIVDGSTILPWWIPFTAIALSTTVLVIVLVKKRFIYFN